MHIHTFTYPQKPQPGDKVAILSPSSGLPQIFPAVFEQGLQRLRDVFQLVPVEYPTTRKMNAPLEERARDVYAAFADPEIKAIICSIGGDDQINKSTWTCGHHAYAKGVCPCPQPSQDQLSRPAASSKAH